MFTQYVTDVISYESEIFHSAVSHRGIGDMLEDADAAQSKQYGGWRLSK